MADINNASSVRARMNIATVFVAFGLGVIAIGHRKIAEACGHGIHAVSVKEIELRFSTAQGREEREGETTLFLREFNINLSC